MVVVDVSLSERGLPVLSQGVDGIFFVVVWFVVGVDDGGGSCASSAWRPEVCSSSQGFSLMSFLEFGGETVFKGLLVVVVDALVEFPYSFVEVIVVADCEVVVEVVVKLKLVVVEKSL